MNFTSDTGIFEDRETGSQIYIEFEGEEPTQINYCLIEEGGVVGRWIRHFQDEFAADVEIFRD